MLPKITTGVFSRNLANCRRTPCLNLIGRGCLATASGLDLTQRTNMNQHVSANISQNTATSAICPHSMLEFWSCPASDTLVDLIGSNCTRDGRMVHVDCSCHQLSQTSFIFWRDIRIDVLRQPLRQAIAAPVQCLDYRDWAVGDEEMKRLIPC